MQVVINANPAITRVTPRPTVVQIGTPGLQGAPGSPGTGGTGGGGLAITGTAATYAALPTTLTSTNAGQAWLVGSVAYVWSGATWPAEGDGISLAGTPGAAGAPGAAGQIRFTGHGAPFGTFVGANPNDTYLDLDSGDVYKLK